MTELSLPQLELLRKAILRVLSANDTGRGLTPDVIMHFLPAEGFTVTADIVFHELQFMERGQFVQGITNRLTPNLRSYRITLEGTRQI